MIVFTSSFLPTENQHLNSLEVIKWWARHGYVGSDDYNARKILSSRLAWGMWDFVTKMCSRALQSLLASLEFRCACWNWIRRGLFKTSFLKPRSVVHVCKASLSQEWFFIKLLILSLFTFTGNNLGSQVKLNLLFTVGFSLFTMKHLQPFLRRRGEGMFFLSSL